MGEHKCAKCNETFQWFYRLVEHVTKKHPDVTMIMKEG